MKCPNKSCKADNPNDARFCHMCGARLQSKKWILLLLLLLTLGFLAVLFLPLFQDTYHKENAFQVSNSTECMDPHDKEPIQYPNQTKDYSETEQIKDNSYKVQKDKEPPQWHNNDNRLWEEPLHQVVVEPKEEKKEPERKEPERKEPERTYRSISISYQTPEGSINKSVSGYYTDEEWNEIENSLYDNDQQRKLFDIEKILSPFINE